MSHSSSSAISEGQAELRDVEDDLPGHRQKLQGSVAPEVAEKYQSTWDSIEVLLGLHEYVKAKDDMAGLINDFKADPVVRPLRRRRRSGTTSRTRSAPTCRSSSTRWAVSPSPTPNWPRRAACYQNLRKANDLGAANDFAGALAILPRGLAEAGRRPRRPRHRIREAQRPADQGPGRLHHPPRPVRGGDQDVRGSGGRRHPYLNKLDKSSSSGRPPATVR